MFQIRNAGVNDIPAIQKITNETWWPTYSPILDAAQIAFMLDHIYSTEALTRAMTSGGQQFLIIESESGPQGFASYDNSVNAERGVKLHKLYVLPGNHNKGFGKALVLEVKARANEMSADFVYLNVNRYNTARTFYEKLGFSVEREEDVPIGQYWMNDYVMRLNLK